ncbi:gephyrin-like molybdotransferase receptor GlpR [Streptomyces sp. NPDC002889]|uniref:divisome protein SepX/GlpR n=1 Tax=Streptomyces sp. NPDC002889 TaxID=3364669 RepID=UPI00368BC869
MSSSGLIYAVIVGAWAAYLVPMWLRRQDELNEARPTERFSTAIRLLSGRAAMERRYAKELRERSAEQPEPEVDPDAVTDRLSSVDVRAFAAPPARTEARMEVPGRRTPASQGQAGQTAKRRGPAGPPAGRRPRPDRAAVERARRSRVLARRRRTTIVLFLAFTAGAIVAAVGGLGFLWAPAVPALLLSFYILHLRRQERRRFAFTMDRRRAEAAAQRLRERGPRRHQSAAETAAEPDGEPAVLTEPDPAPQLSPQEADRRALVEQTDHAEWVDQQRERGPARGDSWDPVPVPLPTYVTAPVAPRASGGVEVSDPETWSAARSSTAEPNQAQAKAQAEAGSDAPAPTADVPSSRRPTSPRRPRERGRTPLFDQYADEGRRRAANE